MQLNRWKNWSTHISWRKSVCVISIFMYVFIQWVLQTWNDQIQATWIGTNLGLGEQLSEFSFSASNYLQLSFSQTVVHIKFLWGVFALWGLPTFQECPGLQGAKAQFPDCISTCALLEWVALTSSDIYSQSWNVSVPAYVLQMPRASETATIGCPSLDTRLNTGGVGERS